jgi:ribosomal protein S18 acetylase RimI-like enzyme
VGFSIRTFRAGDRRAVEALWARVFPDDSPRNAPGRMLDDKLEVQPELLLVGEGASEPSEARTEAASVQIAGAVMAGYDGVRGWIYHLAVAPELRRRGLGAQLVRAAEERLRALGCPKVNLQVRPNNREAVAFYRRLGYEVEERVSLGRLLDPK